MNQDRQKLIEDIGKAAVFVDWNMAFGCKSYGNGHLMRVNRIARHLQEKEGGDLEVVLIGAWIHDVTLAVANDYNPKVVEEETRRFLGAFPDLSVKLREKAVLCAVNHESEDQINDIEARIVHDADALDKCGGLGVVRHIWKMTNMLKSRPLKGPEDLEELKSHLLARQSCLQTRTARKIAKNLETDREMFFEDSKVAENLMMQISILSWEGMISDNIVKWLSLNSGGKWVSSLISQIECRYLSM